LKNSFYLSPGGEQKAALLRSNCWQGVTCLCFTRWKSPASLPKLGTRTFQRVLSFSCVWNWPKSFN